MIMMWDLCALLFCQMNTLFPVAFSYQMNPKNTYRTERAVNHKTSRGRRVCGFTHTATTAKWILKHEHTLSHTLCSAATNDTIRAFEVIMMV